LNKKAIYEKKKSVRTYSRAHLAY